MASNSKKRRRVLGASCILAALIIASSSFAWFTSKDEVTNRLTANADYDVSIVESFAPTAKWLPGQNVNKDVYAVNTGSIGAYVKETISSKATITREVKTDTFSDDCEKLTIAEKYVKEAGSYLALKPAGDTTNDFGKHIVSMTVTDPTSLNGYTANETTNPVITDFKPAANGLYVFRRTVAVSDDKSEEFTYDGYYYKDGEYYKVDIVSVTADNEADIAGDGSDVDGRLQDAIFKYYKLQTTVETPVLTYDSQNNRIVATIPGITSTRTAAEWKTALDTAADNYDKALHDYEEALALQTAAIKENSQYSSAAQNALADLNAKKAAAALAKQEYDYENANYSALNTSYSTENAKIAGLETNANNAKTKMYGSTSGIPNNKPTVADETAPTAAEITAMTDGSYKTYMQAVKASNDEAVADVNAFLDELKAFCKAATGDGGLNMTAADVDGKTLSQLVDSLSYVQLTQFATWIDNNVATQEKHDQFKKAALALEAKKAYEADLADYNAKAEALAAQNAKVANLLAARNASQTALYGATSGTPNNKPTVANEAQPTDAEIDTMAAGSLYKAYMQAVKDQNDAQAAYDSANGDNSAVAGADNATGKSKQLTTANAAVVTAKNNLDAKKAAYNALVDEYNSLGDIEVYINLAKDASNNNTVVQTGGTKDQWQLMDMTAPATSAEFYYTGILEAGETSSQLIDNLTLSPNVSKEMYKSFDFDLNVALDSAQVTYAADGVTLTKDAVTAEFTGVDVTIADPTNEKDTALTWTARP